MHEFLSLSLSLLFSDAELADGRKWAIREREINDASASVIFLKIIARIQSIHLISSDSLVMAVPYSATQFETKKYVQWKLAQ